MAVRITTMKILTDKQYQQLTVLAFGLWSISTRILNQIKRNLFVQKSKYFYQLVNTILLKVPFCNTQLLQNPPSSSALHSFTRLFSTQVPHPSGEKTKKLLRVYASQLL